MSRAHRILLAAAGLCLAGCTAWQRAQHLSAGERAYRTQCTACHNYIPPDEHSAEGWRLAVARYGKGLSPEQREAILDYLTEER